MTTPELSLQSHRSRSALIGLLAGCLAMFLAGTAQQAAAQQIIGGQTYPSVTVDMSVLDDLGRAPNLPQLYQQQARPYPYNYNVQPRFPVVNGSNSYAPAPRVILKPPKPVRQRASQPARKRIAKPRAPMLETRTTRRTPPKPRKTPAPPRKTRMSAPAPLAPVTRAPIPVAPPPPPMIATLPPPSAPKIGVPPPPPPAAIPAPPPMAKTPAPPPVRKTVPQAPKKPRQVAALPKGEARVKSGSMRRIQFSTGSAKLSANASTELVSIAAAMGRDKALRIQLLAYAGQSGDSASQARRLSLSRALAARSTLIEKGIRSTRIDVRALGNKSAGGPEDRVDIIVTKR